MESNTAAIDVLTPGLEDRFIEISTRNLVEFYADDLIMMETRSLSGAIPLGVLRQLRLHGVVDSRRTYRNGKVLYLTEKGNKILREIKLSKSL